MATGRTGDDTPAVAAQMNAGADGRIRQTTRSVGRRDDDLATKGVTAPAPTLPGRLQRHLSARPRRKRDDAPGQGRAE